MKTIYSETVFEGNIIRVSKNIVILPNGKEGSREKIETADGVGIITVTPDDCVLLVKQERYAAGIYTLEIPAGKIDPGETPRAAAIREFREETGFILADIFPLPPIMPMAAICTETVHLFEGRGDNMTFAGTDFDDDEFIEVVKLPFDKAVKMVGDGKIFDAKTVAAILQLYVKRIGSNQFSNTKI